MSNQKLTNIAPTLSLGPTGVSDLSTLPTGNLQASTQPFLAPQIGAHALNITANTLGTLNTLNNSSQGLNTSCPTMSTLNSSSQTLSTLTSPTSAGIPSPQTLLPSSQVTNIVSLPQSFCFSQPSQTVASASSQPPALGVTLGFPLAAASLPLNTNTLPLNAGSPLSQQLVQSLSVGQQPTALSASLPQNLSFPLNQTLIAMPTATAGTSGGQFMSTTLSQFPGLPSVIVSGQQSVLQGQLMGASSTTPGTTLQTLGTLTPQSLQFPLSTGPVVTELPPAVSPVQQADSTVGKVQDDTETSPPKGDVQGAALPAPPEPQPEETVSLSDSLLVSDQQEPEVNSASCTLALLDPYEKPAQPADQSGEVTTAEPEEFVEKQPTSTDREKVPSVSPVPSEHETEEEPDDQNETPEPAVDSQTSAIEEEEAKGDRNDLASESSNVGVDVIQHNVVSQAQGDDTAMEDIDEIDLCSGEIKQEAEQEVMEVVKEDSAVAEATSIQVSHSPSPSPIKVESSSNLMAEHELANPREDLSSGSSMMQQDDSAESSCLSYPSSSKIVEPADSSHPKLPQGAFFENLTEKLEIYTDSEAHRESNMKTHSLLASLRMKEEAMEVDGEEESTPGSDDSQDSYQQRYSPSPMASLQLTRAATITTTSTTAANSSHSGIIPVGNWHGIKEDVDPDSCGVPLAEAVPGDGEGTEFWDEFLQGSGALPIPPDACKHVEHSLESGFVKGMRLEVANKAKPGTYWVASIKLHCNSLLHLRFEGYEEDSSGDFWCHLSASDVHPIGWCAQHGKPLVPPDAIKDKHDNWAAVLEETLKTVPVVPADLLDNMTGTNPIERLKQGMRLELQDVDDPTKIWLVAIMENVGGRLYLRPEGMDNGEADFWAFYLCPRLHRIGWAKQKGYSYAPPKVLLQSGLSQSEIEERLDNALSEAKHQNLPSFTFKYQEEVKNHSFRRGMKLEAVDPVSRNQIRPATVVEVIDPSYFVVEMDDLTVQPEQRTRFSCHSATPTIFPIKWTVYNGIKLTSPPGWPKQDFNWTEYLEHCRALAAPKHCFVQHEEEQAFTPGMKLECVNPENPSQICVATITKTVGHLLWIHLDISNRIGASHVEHMSSQNLFPVGWCFSNGYQLQYPNRKAPTSGAARKRVAVVQPEMIENSPDRPLDNNGGGNYCPKIYFNHKCFSGPFLNKGRIAELQQSVGPGSMELVLKEVISQVVNVAYKPSRVLKELQLKGPANPSMSQQSIKAKYKGKPYRATIEVCKNNAHLVDFCRSICIKLQCCPNLFSPYSVGLMCPEQCFNLTKTKYSYYQGKKKRRIGRPPGGHSNLENGPKKPAGRRRRQNKLGMMSHRKNSAIGAAEEEYDDKASETSDTVAGDSSSSINTTISATRYNDHKTHPPSSASAILSKKLKRKYTHHVPPPSEIKTRGGKSPRICFERKTHKKIILNAPSSGVTGLRSKSLQVHKSPTKYKRAPSPEPLRPSRMNSVPGNNSHKPFVCNSHGPIIQCIPSSIPPLKKNPLYWSVEETVEYIKKTDCAHVAKLFREQEIDGQALLLLTLPTVQEHLELKLGPAIKLCHEIERVKQAFFLQFQGE